MSDTGISSEATSFWVLFNLECDNDNIKKKKLFSNCRQVFPRLRHFFFLTHAKLNFLYADTKMAKLSASILEVSVYK